MKGRRLEGRRNGAGFSFIGILIVLVIIFLLGAYFFQGGEEEQSPGLGGYLENEQRAASLYQSSMQRARNVAQGENLRALQSSIDLWVMQHPGERCTIEKLKADARYTVPQAPLGYHFEIDEQNRAILVKDQAGPGFPAQGAPAAGNSPR